MIAFRLAMMTIAFELVAISLCGFSPGQREYRAIFPAFYAAAGDG